jgi:hypothetical protein
MSIADRLTEQTKADERIELLEKQLSRYRRFVLGIRPHLEGEGYYGFIENIDDLLQGQP